MKAAPYYSFLLTSHDSGKLVSAYVNGMPVGQIVEGAFKSHGFTYPKGEPMLITLNNLPDPFPFDSFAAFKTTLHQAIDRLEMIEPAKKEVES